METQIISQCARREKCTERLSEILPSFISLIAPPPRPPGSLEPLLSSSGRIHFQTLPALGKQTEDLYVAFIKVGCQLSNYFLPDLRSANANSPPPPPPAPGAASFTAIDSCLTASQKKLSLKLPHLCSASSVQVAPGSLAVILIFVFRMPRRVIPGNLKARYNQKGFGNEVFALSH